MYEDDIKAFNDWFENHTDYGTYHHTEGEDGEDLYSVNVYDMERFCEYLRYNVPDWIGIQCMVGKDGIWFRSKDLKESEVI